MRRELAVIGGVPLALDVPQDKAELEGGWKFKTNGSDGMLFDIRRFSRTVPIWIPIIVGNGVLEPLDVLWIDYGIVRALVTHMGGCLQGYGDSVVELPAGSIERYKIHVGSLVAFENETVAGSGH